MWLKARHVEARTAERTLSVLRVHVLSRWASWPLAKISHGSIQEWVNELCRKLAPASVAKCYGTFSMILKGAVRARLIPFNPAEGVTVPSTSRAAQLGPSPVRTSSAGFFPPFRPSTARWWLWRRVRDCGGASAWGCRGRG
jgi:hypothetical protein